MKPATLTRNLFKTGPLEEIELRILSEAKAPRPIGERGITPTYTAHILKVIVVPLPETSPIENNAGRGGRIDLPQEKGGRRAKDTMTFLIARTDITLDYEDLRTGLVGDLIYDGFVWKPSSLEIFPLIYALTASTELNAITGT